MEWNKSFGNNPFVEARVGRWGIHTTANMRTKEPRREDLVTKKAYIVSSLKLPEEVAELILWLALRPKGGPTGQSFSLARRPL